MAAIGNSSIPPKASTAVWRTERALAWSLAGFRAAAVIMLMVTFATQLPRSSRLLPATMLSVVAILDSCVIVVLCVRSSCVLRALVAFDALCLIAVVGLSDVPAVLPGAPVQSFLYNFTVVAAPTFGLPDWPASRTFTAGAGLAFVDLAPSLRADSSYPRWNALPDSAMILGIAFLAALVARLLRGSSEALDHQKQAAVARGSLLARQRERLRQQIDLGTHLMSTVEALVAEDAIRDQVVGSRLRAEVVALRRLVDPESVKPSEPGAGLLDGLRGLVTEKTSAGMQIDFVHEDICERPGAVTPHQAAALVAAAREALNNVLKHSGTDRAVLSVRAADGGLFVTVADRGRGYDTTATPEGFGQRHSVRDRIADIGGRVEIDTGLGQGTTVRLWAPCQTRKK